MTIAEAYKEIMDLTGETQAQIMRRMGLGQSTASNRLNRHTSRVGVALEMASYFGYELVVRPKGSGDPGDGSFVIDSTVRQKDEKGRRK